MAAATGPVTVTTSVRASKTWVLPPRPKPGRKSKKELAVAGKQDLDDDEAERAASRTKQKASRERKQEYIAELEAKVRTYEQGDGERASFFQELAKRYSEEKDALKAENDQLRTRLSRYESIPSPIIPPQLARKASSDLHQPAKRQKTRSASLASTSSIGIPAAASPAESVPAPRLSPEPVHAASLSSKSLNNAASHSSYFATALNPAPLTSSLLEAAAATAGITSHTGGCGLCDKTSSTQCICEEIGIRTDEDDHAGASATAVTAPIDTSCGLCDETASTSCICREIGLKGEQQQFLESSASTAHIASCGFCKATDSACVCREVGLSPSSSASAAITPKDISKAVPLRSIRKAVIGTIRKTIWKLDNARPTVVQAAPPNPATAREAMRRSLIKVGSRLPCSGDPRTCPACADDPAGQAFCSALSSTVCATNPCANCPNRPSPLSQEIPARESTPAAIAVADKAVRQSLRRRESSSRDDVPDAMIPCSDAWATLRAHPNIGYANLDLLANVVAKRTICTGGERRDAEGKVVRVDREGVEEALDLLDHVRE